MANVTLVRFLFTHPFPSLENVSVGIDSSPEQAHSHDAAPTQSVAAAPKAAPTKSSGKALSPDCSVVFGTEHKKFERRLQFSKEEMAVINAGTNDCLGWEKVAAI